jgi:UDP-N-acetylmuramoyl-tripeptide--D-alanyl-D-alanine ligase
MLWTSAELTAATTGTCHGTWQITGLSIDSRTVQPGDLFVAIKGDRLDGHDHAAAALEKGAAAVLVDHNPPKGNHLLVNDTVAALVAIAKAARTRATGKLLAVTGSVGKTTTKEMLHHIAQAQGSAHATYGNLNNHLGLPLTLARHPRDAQIGVFEIGMNHPNEIAPLSRLLQPHIALITTIGTAHIENFTNGQEGIARAKAEIYAGLGTQGTAILPGDSEYCALAEADARGYGVSRFLRFGSKPEHDAQLVSCTVHAQSTDVTARIGRRTLSYRLLVPGEHMAMNSIAALLAAHTAGLDLDKAVASLLSFAPLKGRGIRKQFVGVTVIDECYNASPLSMIAAIKVLGQSDGRKIAALGDMLELGTTAPTAHAELAPVLAAAGVEKVFCCGPLMLHLWNALPAPMKGAHAADAKSLAPLVAAACKSGDVLLVKGSRGQQVEIKGVMSPSMAVIIAALEAKEACHAA